MGGVGGRPGLGGPGGLGGTTPGGKELLCFFIAQKYFIRKNFCEFRENLFHGKFEVTLTRKFIQ